MSLTRNNEKITQQLIALRDMQNENGEFYQRKAFVDHVEAFFAMLRKSIAEMDKRIKNIDASLTSFTGDDASYQRSDKKSLKKRLECNEMVLLYTLEMVENLLEPKESPQVTMFQYGLKIRTFSFPRNKFYYIWPEAVKLEAQKLVFAGTGLNLHALDLFFLDKQIKRADDLKEVEKFSVDKKKQHEAFIHSLKTMRKTILEDLDGMVKEGYTESKIQDSQSNQLAIGTARMLKLITYKEEDQAANERVLKNYDDKLPPQASKKEKFCKALGAVGTMLSAALGFIVGAAVGCVAGAVKGLEFCGVGAIPGAIIGAVTGGVAGAECLSEGVKDLANIPPYESIKRHLLFQPNATHAAKKMNQKALAFLNPNHPDLKQTEKKSTDSINPETLGRYFAYR